jgi:hypothetical protein
MTRISNMFFFSIFEKKHLTNLRRSVDHKYSLHSEILGSNLVRIGEVASFCSLRLDNSYALCCGSCQVFIEHKIIFKCC